MRVLVVHDEPIDGGYGAESYVRRLVGGLQAAGDTVEVLAGVRRHRGVSKVLDPWDPLAWRLVADRARAFRPDVIHHHNVARELSASVLTAAPTVPAVMTVHDQRMLGAREHATVSVRGFAERVGAEILGHVARRHLAATIGVSDRLSALLTAAGFPDVSTVPVPVAAPVGPIERVAGCHDLAVISRLAPDKGVDVVIDAFASLGDQVRPADLLIAGDGPMRTELERRAAPLGGQVRFLGRLDEAEVSALLGGVRTVVVASMPSRRPEGSSLAAIEAAAHGRPVIGSDDPAVAEVIVRAGAGEVVPAGDVAALAEVMRRYLHDDGLVTTVGERASHGVAEHSVAAVTQATRKVYRRVVRPTVGGSHD